MYHRLRQSAVIIALGCAAFMATALPLQAQNLDTTRVAQQWTHAPDQPSWLNLRQIYDKLDAAGYTDIREIERERDGYEAKAQDSEGRRVKLYLDPRTGEVLKHTRRDARDDD